MNKIEGLLTGTLTCLFNSLTVITEHFNYLHGPDYLEVDVI